MLMQQTISLRHNFANSISPKMFVFYGNNKALDRSLGFFYCWNNNCTFFSEYYLAVMNLLIKYKFFSKITVNLIFFQNSLTFFWFSFELFKQIFFNVLLKKLICGILLFSWLGSFPVLISFILTVVSGVLLLYCCIKQAYLAYNSNAFYNTHLKTSSTYAQDAVVMQVDLENENQRSGSVN